MKRPRWGTRVLAGALLAYALTACSATQQVTAAPPTANAPTASSLTPSPSPSAEPPSPSPTSTPDPSPSAAATSTATVIRRLPDAQWKRILATGTWRTGCPVDRAGLRDVDVPYVGFDGATHRGTLVVNADVSASVAGVFARLYRDRYPVHSIIPVEQFGGDDNASMAADNTSAFNCRRSGQANAPSAASPHANGRAVDLNPYENPWVDPRCACFQPDAYFGSHRVVAATTPAGRAVIVKGGSAWREFTSAGWTWQDNSTADYQHFDTGYPSRPLRRG